MATLSVIMSVYNEPVDWIKQAIASILNQTFKDFEFIIVDDNPRGDEQINILQYYKNIDSRIELVFNKENVGLAHSLNKAIEISRGKYIARMDADDIAAPSKFQMQYDYLEMHPNVAVCGTWGKKFGNIPVLSYKKYETPVSHEQVKVASLFASPMIHPSVMLRSDVVRNYMYNVNLRKAQDYDLWGRLLLHDIILCNIPCCLLKYRITQKSQTTETLSKQARVAEEVRKGLLAYLGIDFSEKELVLHNEICNGRICDVAAAEQWLLKLREFLSVRYSSQTSYINQLIVTRWALLCLNANISYKVYRKSEIYSGFSWINTLRFLKRNVL